MSTRERILESAISISNSEGLEALSIRAVATDLGLSPGNVSYHFSRKVDLLLGIAERLSGGNRTTFADEPCDTLAALLERMRGVFQHQYGYRGLILSSPHAMEAHPELRTRYRKSAKERHDQLRAQLRHLAGQGQLELSDDQHERLLLHVSQSARFWLAEYRVIHYRHSLERVIDHYLALIADLLDRYATDAGRASLAPYVDGLLSLPSATE